MALTFVTGNDDKWHVAEAALLPRGIKLVRAAFELPEIQSMEVEEIAAAAAELACAKVGGPVIVTDAGYYFKGLGGFPGPFVKYVNTMLTPEDIIRLMEGKADRRVEIREAVAYCEPGMAPKTFTTVMHGRVAEQPGGTGTLMDRTVIVGDFDKVVALCDRDDVRAYWRSQLTFYSDLGEWLASR